MSIHEWLLKGTGVLNPVYTTIGDSRYMGYIPKIHSEVFGLIPTPQGVLFMGEDDDHYFVIATLSGNMLEDLHKHLVKISNCIKSINTYYSNLSTNIKYHNRQAFLKSRKTKYFNITIQNRPKPTTPLITITHDTFEHSFDVYYLAELIKLIKQVT